MPCLEKKFWVLFVFLCKTSRILGLFLYTPASCHSFLAWTYRMAASLRKRNLNKEYHWRVNVKLSNTKSNKKESKIGSANTEAQVTTSIPSPTACHGKGWTKEQICNWWHGSLLGDAPAAQEKCPAWHGKPSPVFKEITLCPWPCPALARWFRMHHCLSLCQQQSSLSWGMGGKKDVFVYMWSVTEQICFFFFFPHE